LPCGIAVRRGFRPANGIIQRSAHVCDNVVISIRDSSADAILVFAPDGTESTFATDLSNPRGIAFDPSGDLLVAELKEFAVVEDPAAPLVRARAKTLLHP
jgi:glucose/arabinose dehydrogenase